MNNMRSQTLAAAIAMLVWLGVARVAPAQMGSLAAKLPHGVNAVMVIDVAELIKSPLGQQLDLQAKLNSASADRPLAVPGSAKRLAVGAGVHPAGMKTIWEAAVIDLANPPRLESILRAQGGYLDQIAGKRAAWTPRDTLYIELDDHTLGVLRPGQRQFASRWAAGQDKGELSPYLGNALTSAGNADCVFAVDLKDAVGLAALRYALGMGQLPSLEKMDSGQDKLLGALASLKGMKIIMNVTDQIDADWVIDFDQDVSALGSQAKPFVIDVLALADLYEPGVENWKFSVEGKRIVGKGRMEPEGVNRLLALLSPTNVGDAEAIASQASGSESAPEATPAAAPPDAAAVASQSYYRAVSRILDSMSGKPSPQQGATWLVAQARRIQQLPVLNVDPAILEWGNSIADAFNRAAQELALGQQNAMVASQGVASPVAYATYTETGTSSSDTAETRAAFRNAQQQRRQVAQAERAAAAERAFDVFNQVMPTRGKIRVEMSQKYGVEF